ncbi:GNAT family N-acetyltransferase [Nordella sp. HKS 07]|uniref:GNAT family N-acetyltransferase n=1 Tax=Nordella sp. HKS 07 TaxID=2712222 RepID=UPI0013E17D03|nr:GNAT family N-acetyltransferase [Nordella sp. HKS 07]QIG50366.1 GNAT family N-acetyltransferase [Nordella sp. HKS 07]
MSFIQPIGSTERARVLALNNAHAVETSLLDDGKLARMLDEAFLATRIGDVDAFLIVFDEKARYDSPNFEWFRAHYPTFVYVDRIVTGPQARGKGYARALYQDLFEKAAVRGHGRVVCEVNLDPPNPVSDAFHAALGFIDVGRQLLQGSGKTVRYLSKNIPS